MSVYVAVIPNDYRYATIGVFRTREEAVAFLKDELDNGTDVGNATIEEHNI